MLMKIKMKYVFPLIYLVVVLFSLAIASEGLLMIVNIPMMLIYLGLDVYLGIRLGDGFYFAALGGVVQYFILGFLWDKLTDWIQTTRIEK